MRLRRSVAGLALTLAMAGGGDVFAACGPTGGGGGTPSGEESPAAAANGWGAPDIVDTFDGSELDSDVWGDPYNGEGHAGNGRRTPDAITVQDGYVRITATPDGDSGGVAMRADQQYGRWEARVRSDGTVANPVLIVWPESDDMQSDGEYDWLENGQPGEECAGAFMHFPGGGQEEFTEKGDCGAPLSEWHWVGFEWGPDALVGYLDGREWFRTSTDNITEMPSGHMTFQLDNTSGEFGSATFDMDEVRVWSYSGQ